MFHNIGYAINHSSQGQRRLPRLIQLGGCSLLCLCKKIAELARL